MVLEFILTPKGLDALSLTASCQSHTKEEHKWKENKTQGKHFVFFSFQSHTTHTFSILKTHMTATLFKKTNVECTSKGKVHSQPEWIPMKQAIILATWRHKKRHEHWAAGYQNVSDPDRAVPRHWPARPLRLHFKSPTATSSSVAILPFSVSECPSLTILNWYFQHMHPQCHSSVLFMITTLKYHCPEGNIKSKNCGRAYQQNVNKQTMWIHKENLQKERKKDELLD